jgi:hypothetical protein
LLGFGMFYKAKNRPAQFEFFNFQISDITPLENSQIY